MPIYEYRCDGCGHELEAIQKVSDAPLLECPECGAAKLRKLVSAAGFRLKGGGWYETDFKAGERRKNLADSGKDTADSGKAAGGGKGEGAKPEAKAGDKAAGKAGGKAGSEKGGSRPAGSGTAAA